MRLKIVLLVAAVFAAATEATAHPCAADAERRAVQLTRFHVADGGDVAAVNAAVTGNAREMPKVASLRGKTSFDVLEVTVGVYKAAYRNRLIYFLTSGQCLLMGQEVFEASNPR
jgi:hypothetical protein